MKTPLGTEVDIGAGHIVLEAGAPARIQARVGKDFLEKIRRAEFFFSFAHPGFQFAHPGFNSTGGQKPSCDYLNYLNKS